MNAEELRRVLVLEADEELTPPPQPEFELVLDANGIIIEVEIQPEPLQ